MKRLLPALVQPPFALKSTRTATETLVAIAAVTLSASLTALTAFPSLPARAQDESVTLRGDSLQTVESRSTGDFPGLRSREALNNNPDLNAGQYRQAFPQVRLNERVDVLYRKDDSLGLFGAPGEKRPSGTVNLRLQLEE
ncbi:hypothetical protein [Roseofilum casamattae]|uniref:Uncharacterized protein n=1 Tax=Roseofilum casamattae BLCC-M143 TaxID=3022442 RepID=A0ABT7BVM0_9CYAN|nr:hypothetical protein [Roseofilum casamattae]MDJ1182554.1 hypothetical protein [Roseofilum casamattae BLCC-M143]